MKILVYGINYAPELCGIGKFTGEMAEWLGRRGHEVRVVSAVPYYPMWEVATQYRGFLYTRERLNGVDVFRSTLYVPRRPATMGRVLHLASFALLSFPQILRSWRWRPDLVMGVEPTLFAAPGLLFAARFFRAKTLLHIQDFELDAMFGLGILRGGAYGRWARAAERLLMRQFDAVSSISETMVERAREKLGNAGEVLLFRNWVDTDFVKPGSGGDVYREAWGISRQSKVVLYSGNLGKKQGLESVLYAASKLKDEKDIVFVLVGGGAAIEDLKQLDAEFMLDNVLFFPLQPYERLPDLMALADVHLIVQRRGAADVVFPSKLTTILASGGNVLITADSHTDLGRFCDQHPDIARRVEPDDAELFADALRAMLSDVDVDNRRPNLAARAYAKDSYDKERVLERFERDLLQLVGQKGRA